jgi:hypothetical protein
MVVAGGLVAFVFSFFDYVGVSASVGPVSYSASTGAWHSYAVLGLLLIFAAAIAWALRALAVVAMPTLPTKFEYVVGGAAGLGTLLVLLRGVTYSSSFPGGSVGLRFGGIVLIIAGAVVTGGALWASKVGSALPASTAWTAGGFTPSAPPQSPSSGSMPSSGGFPPPAPPDPPQ